jgi:hypothetical protein
MPPNAAAETRTLSRWGASLTAHHNADGTWDIYDVPIFAELAEGAKPSVKTPIGREWMDRAVKFHQSKYQRQGILNPFHLEHHGRSATRRGGNFLPKRVAEFDCLVGSEEDGTARFEKRWTLFADLLGIHPEIFAEIKEGRWPFVSVEVLDWNTPELTSLSLLDDDMPFFQFPPLRPERMVDEGEPVKADNVEQNLEVVRSANIGTFSRGSVFRRGSRAVAALFAFELGDKRSSPGKDEEKSKSKDGKEEKPTDEKIRSEDADEKEKAKPKDEDGSPSEKKDDGDKAAEPSSREVLDAIKSLMTHLGALNAHLGFALPGAASPANGGQNQMADKSPNAGTVPVEPKDASELCGKCGVKGCKGTCGKTQLDAVKEEATKMAAVAAADQITLLQARLSALEAEQGEREKVAKVKGIADKAMKDLEGYPQKPDLRGVVERFAAIGQEHVDLFVKTYQASVPKDPPANLAAFERQIGHTLQLEDPAEVTKFAANPDELAAARVCRDEWELLRSTGYPLPLARHLELNVKERVASMKAGK